MMDFATLIDNLKREMCPMKLLKMMNSLEKLKSYDEIFEYFWSFDEVHWCLSVPSAPPAKSREDAELMRVEGNAHYKDKRYDEALECYNHSIVMAPHPEITTSTAESPADGDAAVESGNLRGDKQEFKTLADGYLNRSAVLLMLKKFDKCLLDLELVSKYAYSDITEVKIKERREKCLKAKEEAEDLVKKPPYVSNNTKIPPNIREPNEFVPVFSNSVSVVHSSTKGRHLVATRNIRAGELIAVEESYCSRMFFHTELTFCPVCLMTCGTPVPCPGCNLVAFCSEDCRIKGLNQHMSECKILPAMDLLGLCNNTEASLAMKTLVRTTFVELRDMFPILKKEAKELPPEKRGFNENGVFKSDEYRTIFHMANARRKIGSGSYLFTCCAMAYIMTRVLLESEVFYVDRSGQPFTPTHSDLMLTGTALLHHYCIYPNVFCLSDLIVTSPSNSTYKKVVGEALYPALMSFRHACNAQTAHYTFGHVRIVKTTLPVSVGEEVTLCYGGKFHRNSSGYRRMQLETFGIFCRCEACENEWPCFPDVSEELRFKCIRCNIPLDGERDAPSCSTCQIIFSKTKSKGEKKSVIKRFWTTVDRVREADKKFKYISYKIETNRILSVDDFRDLSYYIDLLHRHVKQPCVAMCKARDLMLIFFYKDNKYIP